MQKEVKMLLLTNGLILFAVGLFGPLYAVFVEEIGGDLLTAGLAYGLFAFSAGFLIFLVSKWEDRVKHQEKLIVAGYALQTLGFLGYLFVQSPLHLFIVQVVFGISLSISIPAYDGVYTRHLDKRKLASGWGAWEGMFWMVAGVSGVAGGYIANTYGFRTLFIIMFALSLIALLTAIATLPRE